MVACLVVLGDLLNCVKYLSRESVSQVTINPRELMAREASVVGVMLGLASAAEWQGKHACLYVLLYVCAPAYVCACPRVNACVVDCARSIAGAYSSSSRARAADMLDSIERALAAGALRPVVGSVHALADAPAAHEEVRASAR